jgi:D-3-phosphoglycerate dehydrogenase
MVGQISTLVAGAGLNKSKGDLAYTLVDVDSDVAPELFAQVKSIEGVFAAGLV